MAQVGPEPIPLITVYATVASLVTCFGIPLAKVLMLRMKRFWNSAEGQKEIAVTIEKSRLNRQDRVLRQIASEHLKNKSVRG